MNQTIENNITKTEKIIQSFDTHLVEHTHAMLAPLYGTKYGPFLAQTYFDIPLLSIIAAVIALSFFLLLRKLFTTLTLKFLQPLANRTETIYDDRVIAGLKGPISFMFVIIGVNLFFNLLFLNTPFVNKIINSMIAYNIFWVIYELTVALRGLVYRFTYRLNPELSHEMGNFILTMIRGIIIAIGLGTILQTWDINVTGLIAGLGIGGLAFALAAKDTAANLFGSIALLFDKSIRIGEWIKVDGVEGTVEDIGMRTTKIRSFENSLIMLPNQVIANSPIENFSRRGTRRIKMTIGLTYRTTSGQIEKIVKEIKTMLKSHEGISQESTLLVNFTTFNDSSLGIFIYTFTNTAVWAEYLRIQEDINLKIMKIVEANGSNFAFPSQSVYVEQVAK